MKTAEPHRLGPARHRRFRIAKALRVKPGAAGASSPGVAGAVSPGIGALGSSEHQRLFEIIRSSSSGIIGGPSAPRIVGSRQTDTDYFTLPTTSPWFAPTACEPRLTRASTGAEPNSETNCQLKGVHALMIVSGRTTAGIPRGRTCGLHAQHISTYGTHGLSVHPQFNLRPPLLLGRTNHLHRGQDVDTDCIINSGSGADGGNQLWGERVCVSFQLMKELILKSLAEENGHGRGQSCSWHDCHTRLRRRDVGHHSGELRLANHAKIRDAELQSCAHAVGFASSSVVLVRSGKQDVRHTRARCNVTILVGIRVGQLTIL